MESIHEIGKFENYRSNPGCRETIDFFFFFLFYQRDAPWIFMRPAPRQGKYFTARGFAPMIADTRHRDPRQNRDDKFVCLPGQLRPLDAATIVRRDHLSQDFLSSFLLHRFLFFSTRWYRFHWAENLKLIYLITLKILLENQYFGLKKIITCL